MSKPSELLAMMQTDILRLWLVDRDRLDGELRDKIETELRDAQRLICNAVEALVAADPSLDRNGHT